MRKKQRSANSPRLSEYLARGDVVFEFLCWTVAWLVLPALLASRGSGLRAFLTYAVVAGALLSIGGLANGSPSFDEPWALASYAVFSSVAILLAGGLVFGVMSALT
jgi:hypothetical protein